MTEMEIPEALLRTFRDETDEVLAELERCALELGGGGAQAPLIESMFRSAHTLKGNASCLGFDALTQAAHQLEETLDAARKTADAPGPTIVGLVLGRLDTLARLAAEAVAQASPLGAPTSIAADRATQAIRVEVARLDRALDLVGEIGVARARLGAGDHDALEAIDVLVRDLQARILDLRLIPIRDAFERFRRAIRDLAIAAGKEVRLDLRCDDCEVDVAVADALRGPLAHLIRNAVDHGIEGAAARRAAGKPSVGTVTLAARHEGSHLLVELSDDGAGLSRERLLERGRALGLSVDDSRDAAVWELAFAPGLSTAKQVTDLSGRGIGMDVVRRTIEGMRGSVTLASRAGRGVTATIRLPLTLSIVQGLAVGVEGETYVLPLDHVVECLELERDRSVKSTVGGVLELRGEALPFISLARAVGARGDAGSQHNVVVVEQDGRRAGLAVDRLHGEVQTVIKPLGSLLDGVRGLAGSALLADGRVALVVDVRGLLRAAVG
jgi:two-component system, chemotaxis family, sensor kinase CheA